MTYSIPQKTILTKGDLESFQVSDAKSQLLDFIKRLANSVKGKPMTIDLQYSEPVKGLINILLKLKEAVLSVPPVTQYSRYGKNTTKTKEILLLQTGSR